MASAYSASLSTPTCSSLSPTIKTSTVVSQPLLLLVRHPAHKFNKTCFYCMGGEHRNPYYFLSDIPLTSSTRTWLLHAWVVNLATVSLASSSDMFLFMYIFPGLHLSVCSFPFPFLSFPFLSSLSFLSSHVLVFYQRFTAWLEHQLEHVDTGSSSSLYQHGHKGGGA